MTAFREEAGADKINARSSNELLEVPDDTSFCMLPSTVR